MNVSDFYYDLPKELIAQDPLEDRAASRLLVLGKKDGSIRHETFRDVTGHLRAGMTRPPVRTAGGYGRRR